MAAASPATISKSETGARATRIACPVGTASSGTAAGTGRAIAATTLVRGVGTSSSSG
jgi:hypothetical protein